MLLVKSVSPLRGQFYNGIMINKMGDTKLIDNYHDTIGILNKKAHCVVGNGVVVHLRGLLEELKTLRDANIDYKG